MSEFLLVAQKLLEIEKRPMRPKELVKLAFDRQFFSDNIAGQTPWQTMKAKLSVHVRRLGERSVFVRTEPGKFYLRHLLDGETVYPAPPLVPPRTHERVLVFSTNELDPLMTFQGVTRHWQPLLKKITKTLLPHYQPRLTVEDDEKYTQILTYILVTKKGRVLAYRRGTYNRAAEFLRGSFCVGFGGHVVDSDPTLFSESPLGLADSAIRELSEELRLPDADVQRLKEGEGLEIIGALNDDSSPVGRRHLAFVMQYEVSDDPAWQKPERGEKSITQLQWLGDTTSRPQLSRFEYWSQLCLREFAAKLSSAQAAFLIRQRARMKPPHLLCVVGEVGSGKSEATRVLTSEFGYREINSGRILADLMGIRPIPKTRREEFQRRAEKFINKTNGPQRLAKRLWSEAEKIDSDRILIDGLRHKSTLAELRSAANRRVGVIFVETPHDVAFSFYRSRFARGCSIEEFVRVREAAVEREVRSLIDEADVVLYNWRGRIEYRAAIRTLMRDLGIPK
jgi:predicted NUDIX family phosphoesterase/adenylate kinase family enzyme